MLRNDWTDFGSYSGIESMVSDGKDSASDMARSKRSINRLSASSTASVYQCCAEG